MVAIVVTIVAAIVVAICGYKWWSKFVVTIVVAVMVAIVLAICGCNPWFGFASKRGCNRGCTAVPVVVVILVATLGIRGTRKPSASDDTLAPAKVDQLRLDVGLVVRVVSLRAQVGALFADLRWQQCLGTCRGTISFDP